MRRADLRSRAAFDDGTHLHLALGPRAWLLERIDLILTTVERPDRHELDPIPPRERFYRRNIIDPVQWLRVVVHFEGASGWVVTALVQDDDPRGLRR